MISVVIRSHIFMCFVYARKCKCSRSASSSPPLRYSQIPVCLHSASSSFPFRYSQIQVFALGLIFPSSQLLAIPGFAVGLIFLSSQIFANANVCAQPHLPLLSDTRKYQCFALSLTFPSCQILANTSVGAQPGIPLLLYSQLPVFALRLIFPTSQILASTNVRARKCQWLRSGSYIPSLR